MIASNEGVSYYFVVLLCLNHDQITISPFHEFEGIKLMLVLQSIRVLLINASYGSVFTDFWFTIWYLFMYSRKIISFGKSG